VIDLVREYGVLRTAKEAAAFLFVFVAIVLLTAVSS
jgi:hypothetical protein